MVPCVFVKRMGMEIFRGAIKSIFARSAEFDGSRNRIRQQEVVITYMYAPEAADIPAFIAAPKVALGILTSTRFGADAI
jgi:hypothetical protein